MLFNYLLSAEAENDVLESYVWYENQKDGLGERFLSTLDLAKDLILSNPNTYKLVFKKRVRAFHLSEFPFTIYHHINRKDVNVLAIFHTSGNPSIWKKRT